MSAADKLTDDERLALTDETAFRAHMLIAVRELRSDNRTNRKMIEAVKGKVAWISAGISALFGMLFHTAK